MKNIKTIIMKTATGITDANRQAVATALAQLFADENVLSPKKKCPQGMEAHKEMACLLGSQINN